LKNLQIIFVTSISLIYFSLNANADSNTVSTPQINKAFDTNRSQISNDNNTFSQKIVKFFRGIVDDAYDFAEINGIKKSEKGNESK